MSGLRVGCAAALVFALLGCGGSGGSTGSGSGTNPTGNRSFYRGTITANAPGAPVEPNGQAAVANWSNGSLSVLWSGASSGTLIWNSPTAELGVDGYANWGPLKLTSAASGFSFVMTGNNGKVAATGTFLESSLPSLGPLGPLPEAGTYSGELLETVAGSVLRIGQVSGTVQSDGQFSFISGGTDEEFLGQFLANGSAPGAVYEGNGSAYEETSPPRFSWDGQTLRVEFPDTFAGGVQGWLTLKYDSSATSRKPR